MQIESVNEPIIAVRRSQYPEGKNQSFYWWVEVMLVKVVL